MPGSDAQIQRKTKIIRKHGVESELMVMSLNVSNTLFSLENSVLYARPQSMESALAFITTAGNECKRTIRKDIRQSVILSTVDKIKVMFKGAWVIETLTMSQSTTLFSFLDFQMKVRNVNNSHSEKRKEDTVLVRTDKDLVAVLEDENKSMMAMFISTLLKPKDHQLDELFSFIRSVESYWISYFLLSQMMNEDKENDCQKIGYACKAYGVSESYFRKLCHDAFTRGPKKQLRLWRAAHSALQLIDKEKSISIIAGNNGYSSSSHFSCEIKSLFGITPRDFKKLESLFHE